jgi:hypothetical protein
VGLPPSADTTSVQVPEDAAWKRRLGCVVTDVKLRRSDFNSERLALVAVDVALDGATRVTFALGEGLPDGKPKWIPDKILVFFEPSLADTYLAETAP